MTSKRDKNPLTKAKGNGYNWGTGDKARAVAAYSVTGSFGKAAVATGIPEMTIRYWAKQDWFAEELKRADQADTDELKTVYTRIAKKAAASLEDRLEHGDEVLNKEGEVIRKQVAARDLAIITGVAADQRRKQMEAPTVVSVQSSDERLLNLLEKFTKFARAKELKGEAVEQKEENSDVREAEIITEEPARQDSSPSEGDTNPSGAA